MSGVDEKQKYIDRIRKNIKESFKEGMIIKRYSFKTFCSRFIAEDRPLETPIKEECICGHKIVHNYKYKHVEREDYFILGSCCIKKFSEHYKNHRTCKECGCKIKKNKTNRCSKCKKKIEYINKCKCKQCGYQKKDNKYKYCYKCFEKKKKLYI